MHRRASPSRRLTLVVTLVGALSVSGVGASPSANAGPASSTSLDLPLTGLGEMLVDAAHGHIFITGYGALSSADFTAGTGDSVVVVVNTDGTLDTTITDVPGAAGMDLDAANHTLYVAEYDGDAVLPIDTETLDAGTEIPLGADADCPSDVAVAGGAL